MYLNEAINYKREKPRVSIGLPVYNGEKYLKDTIDSILSQSYTDFELIISDNASSDNTQEICRAYAAKDKRIRYYQNRINIKLSKNFNRVFELSSGEYFKWNAYDDLLAPEFLSRCVSVLDQNPSIVLCHSKTGKIDEHGKLIGSYDHKMRIDSKKPHERFGDLIRITNPCWWIFGLIRASSLRKTPLLGEYVHADRNLLAEIALIGRIYEIPAHLFFRRDHPQAYTQKYIHGEHVNYKEQLSWWTNTRKINLGNSRNFLEYFKSVSHVPLKWSERLLCNIEIVKWFIREGWFFIGRDLVKGLLPVRIRAILKPLWIHTQKLLFARRQIK